MALHNVHLIFLFHKKSCLNFGDNITLHTFNNKKYNITFNLKKTTGKYFNRRNRQWKEICKTLINSSAPFMAV